jgi:putative NADPH-quinone reductase
LGSYQIHAHPAGANSFNGACFQTVKEALEGAGNEVKALSLYEKSFQPALTADDLKQYM